MKPNQQAFVITRSLYRLTYSFVVLSVIFSIWGPSLHSYAASLLLILFNVFSLYALQVSFLKEKYIFYPDKIIHKKGGIFSDSVTELLIKNITHVTLVKPFIEMALFKTGSVKVDSAGSGSSEIWFRSLDNPEELYYQILDIMRQSGFHLKMDNVIQEETPSSVGVFFEVLQNAFLGVLVLYYITSSFAQSFPQFFPLGIILILGYLGYEFGHYKSRRYYLYDDTIVYTEKFLTEVNVFIPSENLTDCTVTQTFFEKLFGVYDVYISCKGGGAEIHFKNIINGKDMEKNLDLIIAQRKKLEPSKITEEHDKLTGKKDYYSPIKKEINQEITAVYRPSIKRFVLPYLFLIPFIILFYFISPITLTLAYVGVYMFFLGTFSAIVTALKSRYEIKPLNVEMFYSFLTTQNIEFSLSDVTGLIVERNFIDYWLNTCSIEFWSIGSSGTVSFSNISMPENIYATLKRKIGIESDEEIYRLQSTFTFDDWIKSSPISLLLIPTLALIVGLGLSWSISKHAMLSLAINGVVIGLYYVVFYYYNQLYYNNCYVIFNKEYIYYHQGYLFENEFFVFYRNIKDIKSSQYPFSKTGTLNFNIAGEHIVGEGDKKTYLSNYFSIDFIKNAHEVHDLMDIIFYYGPDKERINSFSEEKISEIATPVRESKPVFANSLAISIIVFPLIILLPYTYFLVKSRQYCIDGFRVLAYSGVFFKDKSTILYPKIDFINENQGFFNKMFTNGNITVNTTGSTHIEMSISNITDYLEFYEELKEHY